MDEPFLRHPAAKIRHKKNHGFRLFAVIAVIVLLAAGWFWYQNSRYQYYISTPVDPSDNTKISFTVNKGDSTAQIAKNLKDKELILDEDSFKNYLRGNSLDRKVVAGRFLLNKTETVPQIAAAVTDTKQSQFILTVPEGSTVTDIDAKLADMDLIKPGEFTAAADAFGDWDKYPFLDKEKSSKLVHPLEGYLFPDTYFLNPENFHVEDLIQMMLNDFRKKLDAELSKQHSRSLFDIVTMASILEKEVRTQKDLPIVAGILWKRLDNNWMLGADSTLLYLKDDRSIDYKDLQADSPYNTRNRTGLPPGPINNPGLDCIMAAINPQESQYFYYLTKPGTGEVVYAVTNEEQNVNKQKYLQ